MITQEISPSPSTCTNLIVWALLWKNTRTLPVLCCRFSPHGCWHTHAKVVLRGESFMQKKFGPHPQLAFWFSSHSISCLCICFLICICISRFICINLLSWASSISGFLFPSHSISDRSEKQALVEPPLQSSTTTDVRHIVEKRFRNLFSTSTHPSQIGNDNDTGQQLAWFCVLFCRTMPGGPFIIKWMRSKKLCSINWINFRDF